ncbi:MAG TPA: hypothetical protein VMY88_09045 [Acidimicrobiales bacterium]|nr:hypothetical protein [Acidimicrobiales bacterium]
MISNDAPRGAKRPFVILLISAVMALAVGVAIVGGRNEGTESDIGRPEETANRDRLLASQRKSAPSTERCLNSLLTVEAAGLTLRDQTEFRCPGAATEPGEERHWGATCWETELCRGGSYIAVDEELIGRDDARLRYVIAHEICHVNSYMRTGEPGSEPAADRCAATAGFPRR